MFVAIVGPVRPERAESEATTPKKVEERRK
jgi:hypothetical protein